MRYYCKLNPNGRYSLLEVGDNEDVGPMWQPIDKETFETLRKNKGVDDENERL